MELTPSQRDALTELINIGYGRAAGALSELTGYRIILEVPKVAMHPVGDMALVLERVINGEVVTDEEAAVVLSGIFSEHGSPDRGLDTNAREIVTEVGNIVLNACLGVFGNLLQVQVSFAVPRLHVELVGRILESISFNSAEKIQYALMVQTTFRLRASDITGYLIIILGVTSLERLLSELEKWENRQTR
jgi:chemotaxis protein CheC